MRKYLNLRANIALIVIIAFTANISGPWPNAQAQDLSLPAPGVMVALSPEFNPPVLKGIKVHPNDPFRFDFILDRGDSRLSDKALKNESARLIKYFLASLTIPENDLWVNLSPYEKDRIIPNSFGLTEMGRDLLAEDYMLKQITASLIYPEGETGKKFWKKVYEQAARRYGTTSIPVNTFNKVWIVPQKAVVYENAKAGTAYVIESKLKVMLEQDYLSIQKHEVMHNDMTSAGADIIRAIVIPELNKEVNEGQNFAQLRQVYNSLILAAWYKKKIKDSLLSRVYADKNKVAGVNTNDPREKEKIYERYLQAFKKGAYNYIKEETDPATQQIVPRKYFSGGFSADRLFGHGMDSAMSINSDPSMLSSIKKNGLVLVMTSFALFTNPISAFDRPPVSAVRSTGLSAFFQGVWSGYMTALARGDKDTDIWARELIYQAKQHSQALGGMMQELTDSARQFSIPDNSPLNAQKWMMFDRFMDEWTKFNIGYLIPNGYYGDLLLSKDLENNRYYYDSIIYKLIRSEKREVDHQQVLTLYGRKIDGLSRKLFFEAQSYDQYRIIFINSDDIDTNVHAIAGALAGGPYLLSKFGQAIDIPLITSAQREAFAGMNEDQIRKYIEHTVRGYEFTHQAQDMLKVSYKGTDRFGNSEFKWSIMGPRMRTMVDAETVAMLGQLLVAQKLKPELIEIFDLVLTGASDPYYTGARWVLNQLDGKPPGRWTDWIDDKELTAQINRLLQTDPVLLRARVMTLIRDNWSEKLLQAILNADSAMSAAPQAEGTGVNEMYDKNRIKAIINNWFDHAPASGRKILKNEWLVALDFTNEPILLYTGTFDDPKALCLSLLGKESEIPVSFGTMTRSDEDQKELETILGGLKDKKIIFRLLTESSGEKPGSGRLLWRELVRRYGQAYDLIAIEGYKGNRGSTGMKDWGVMMTDLGYQKIRETNIYFRKAGPLDKAMNTPPAPKDFTHAEAVKYFESIMIKPSITDTNAGGLIRMNVNTGHIVMCVADSNEVSHNELIKAAHQKDGYATGQYEKGSYESEWISTVLGWDENDQLSFVDLFPPTMRNPNNEYSSRMLQFLGLPREALPFDFKNAQYRKDIRKELILIYRLIQEAALKKGIDPKGIEVLVPMKNMGDFKSSETSLDKVANLKIDESADDLEDAAMMTNVIFLGHSHADPGTVLKLIHLIKDHRDVIQNRTVWNGLLSSMLSPAVLKPVLLGYEQDIREMAMAMEKFRAEHRKNIDGIGLEMSPTDLKEVSTVWYERDNLKQYLRFIGVHGADKTVDDLFLYVVGPGFWLVKTVSGMKNIKLVPLETDTSKEDLGVLYYQQRMYKDKLTEDMKNIGEDDRLALEKFMADSSYPETIHQIDITNLFRSPSLRQDAHNLLEVRKSLLRVQDKRDEVMRKSIIAYNGNLLISVGEYHAQTIKEALITEDAAMAVNPENPADKPEYEFETIGIPREIPNTAPIKEMAATYEALLGSVIKEAGVVLQKRRQGKPLGQADYDPLEKSVKLLSDHQTEEDRSTDPMTRAFIRTISLHFILEGRISANTDWDLPNRLGTFYNLAYLHIGKDEIFKLITAEYAKLPDILAYFKYLRTAQQIYIINATSSYLPQKAIDPRPSLPGWNYHKTMMSVWQYFTMHIEGNHEWDTEIYELMRGLELNDFMRMVRNASGDHQLDVSDLSRRLAVIYYEQGVNKYLFRVILDKRNGGEIEFLLALIKKPQVQIHQLPELADLKLLQGRQAPRWGGEITTPSGRTWLGEEFIKGPTLASLRAFGNGLTEGWKLKTIGTLLNIAKHLGGAVPQDIRRENFIRRNSNGDVVMVDIGNKRFHIYGERATPQDRLFFLANFLLSYGYQDVQKNSVLFKEIDRLALEAGGVKGFINSVKELLLHQTPDGLLDLLSENLLLQNMFPGRERMKAFSEYLSASLEKYPSSDDAMISRNGGIDLTPANINLQLKNAGEGIKFHLDPAMLKKLQNAPGFTPVIITIKPMNDLQAFLGLSS